MMLFSAARLLGPPKSRGVPASQAKPIDAGPVTRCIIIGVVAAIVIAFYGTGHLPGWMTAASLLLGIVCVAGILCTNIKQADEDRRRLSNMRSETGVLRHTASELRASADALTPDVTVITGVHRARPAEPYVPRHRAPYESKHRVTQDAPPAARTATVPVQGPPTPHLDKLQQRHGTDARMLRVAAILITPCSFCSAGPGESCRPIEGVQWYELDKPRSLYAHSLRIARAIAVGNAPLDDVKAQFGNDNLPDEIWRSLL